MAGRIKPQKREIKKVVEILKSTEFSSEEEMASALVDLALNDLAPNRFKHVVVGQVHPREGLTVSDEEGRDTKVAFLATTKGDATKVGQSLALSYQTGDVAKWWALEVESGTPSEFYKRLKKKHERKGFLDGAHPRELRLAMQTAWIEKNGEPLPPELQGNGWEDLEWFAMNQDEFMYLLDEQGEETEDG